MGKTGILSTFAGTGSPGSPVTVDLRQQRSCVSPIALPWIRRRKFLLICDIGNQRIRRVEFATRALSTRSPGLAPTTNP